MRTLAVIPARSGSKGLTNKNIKELNGKPLIAYSILAARDAGIFDTIHVSTDSIEYAKIAKQYGIDVPFMRREELASDKASTWDVVRFVLEEYKKRNLLFDVVVVLQPTSPLRTKEDILNAFKFFEEKKANMVSSVCEVDHSPLWCNVLPPDLSMKEFEREEIAFLTRQELPTYYRENGAIYIIKVPYLLSEKNIYSECYAYIMDKKHSIDIDDELDFLIAQSIMLNIES